MSQNATSKIKEERRGGRRKNTRVFTEQGVVTLSMILKSQSETLELKHEKYSKYLPYILIE